MVRFQSAQRSFFDLNLLPEQEPESDHQPNLLPEQESDDQPAQKKFPFRKAIGFRFDPTDVELVLGYLKPFLEGKALPKNKIHVKDIYLYHPNQLLVEFEKGNEKELFFFTPRSLVCSGGERVARSANGGFWHSTTGSKDIIIGDTVIGVKQCFNFFDGKLLNGRRPKEGKTNWLMIEYRLVEFHKSIKKSSSVKTPTRVVDLNRSGSEASSSLMEMVVDGNRSGSEASSSLMEMVVDGNRSGSEASSSLKEMVVDGNRSGSEASSSLMEMVVDLNRSGSEKSSSVKEMVVTHVLSKVYYKYEEDNKTYAYAEFIKTHQELVIQDEKIWEDMQENDEKHSRKRTCGVWCCGLWDLANRLRRVGSSPYDNGDVNGAELRSCNINYSSIPIPEKDLAYSPPLKLPMGQTNIFYHENVDVLVKKLLILDADSERMMKLEENSGTEEQDARLLEEACVLESHEEARDLDGRRMSRNKWSSVVYRRGQKQLTRLFLKEAEYALHLALSSDY
ncbi:unnamed protein product [Arabidopsis arenosa]|uniref:NAC domain-containing protein n=1 Tax=Arabidopsis arenosa TaxID=38785 RepID=A0A8S1ZBF7_ARAAE|nr:unnamed protein product [Arabidopsis arenosa]